MTDSRVKEILRDHEYMQTARGPYESQWREIAERILPEQLGFNAQEKGGEGQKKNEKVFDSTARIALGRYASALESVTVPRSQQWHKVRVLDESVKNSLNVKRYLEEVNSLLFRVRYSPRTNFASQAHAMLISNGAFGNGPMFIDDIPGVGIRYCALHIGEIYIALDAGGMVDKVHRRFEYTARQAMQKWGEENIPQKIRDAATKDPNKKFEFLHCVKPNEDVQHNRADYRGMKFSSYYVSIDGEAIVSEGGYRTMPYVFARGTTAPREIYPRGPASVVLPDIKMVNEMEKTNLRILHRLADPPLLLTEDGALSAFSTRPGALNPGGIDLNGNAAVIPLQTGARPDLVEAKLDKTRSAINDAFLITLFQILVENGTMTATEALIRAQEKGMLLAPTVGRLQTDWLGPQIEREIDIFAAAGLLPEMPQELADIGGEIDIEYVSPLSRAIRAEDGIAIMNTLQSLMPVAQIDPSALEVFDWVETARELADINGFPAKALKTPERIAEERAVAAQRQQQADLLAAAPIAAETAKNMAMAQKTAAGGA